MITPLSLAPGAAFLLGLVVKATLLLLAAGAATLALRARRAPAAARHLVWTLAVCGLLALPLLSAALPGWRLGFVTVDAPAATVAAAPVLAAAPLPAAAPTSAAPAIAVAGAAIAGFAEVPAPLPLPAPRVGDPALAGSVDGGIRLALLIPGIYLLVVLGLLGRIAAGRVGVRRLARRAERVTDEGWTALARDLAWTLDVGRPVTLLRGGRATMPMTWGVRRPTILLPAEADHWPKERRRVVLLHELAHVGRYDCLTQTLASVACALYWFHPGAWHAARRLRVERELACDDRVLAAGTRAREYAAHLLEVARAFRAPALAGAAAVSMARPSQLEGRLLAVLDGVRDRHGVTRRTAGWAAAAAVALVLPLAAMRPGSARAAEARMSPAEGPIRTPGAAPRVGSGCTMTRGTSFDCQVEARPGERLTLELPDRVSARVVGRDRGGVWVRAETGRTLDVRAERVAGGVRVAVTGRREGDGTEPDLVIEVPRRFDVQASADGGGVEIRGVRGTFTGHTRGGGLALIGAEGTLRMDAGGGGAYLQDTRLDGRLEMGGGGVMMGENHGSLDVRGAGATVVGTPGEARGWSDRLRARVDQERQDERARDAAIDARDGAAAQHAAEVGRAASADGYRGTAALTGGGRAAAARGAAEAQGAAAMARAASADSRRVDEDGRATAAQGAAEARRAAEMARAANADARRGTVAIARRDGAIDVRYAPDGANLWTGAGDVRVVRASGHVLAHTGRGNVTVQSLAGSARVSTGAGDVSVAVAGQGGDVEITSGGGAVTLMLPADFSGALEVESAYTQGHAPTRVVSEFPLVLTQPQGWDVRQGTPRRSVRGRGTLGSGRYRVHVAALNGDVRVVRAGRGGSPVTTRVDGGDVTCQGEECVVRLNGRHGVVVSTQSGASSSSWVVAPGGREAAAAGAVAWSTGTPATAWRSAGRQGDSITLVQDGRGYAYATGDVEGRIESIRAMARYAPAAAAAQGIAGLALGDGDPRVQRAAVDALAGLRGAARDQQLRRIAREHRSAEIRQRAAAAVR